MAVAVNTERAGVEISWDPAGAAAPPEVNVPEFPTHPIIGDPSAPVDPDAHPEHPIYLPPGIWGGSGEPFPGYGLPEAPGAPDQSPPAEGGAFPGDPGYNPPSGGNVPAPVLKGDDGNYLACQVFAQGQDGDWSNTAIQPNDGLALLSYPKGFSGSSYVEVRALDGTLIDAGTIEVEV